MKGLVDQVQEGGDQADLTPMIDCVFLLLLFFIVTTTFSEETNLFKVELPKAANSQVKEVEDLLTVAISKDGKIAIGQDYVPDDELFTYLKTKNKSKKIEVLIISGDKNCPYEKVVLAMDVAQALSIPSISLAVEQK